MFEKVRSPLKSKNWNMKAIVAYVLFGAIILVFALFGIVSPDRFSGGVGGGSAAVVNDTNISYNEFRQRVENVERSSKLPFDKLPPEQRALFSKEIQRRTLEQMIMSEVVYQTAHKQGIWAANGQIRDEIFNIPVFQDSGKFVRSKYDNYLSAVGQSSDDFERQIRKDIVIRKMQEMFQTANMPSTTEVDQLSALNGEMVNFRFVELAPSKLDLAKTVTDSEAKAYLQANEAEAKKYYDQHALDYSVTEKVKARHILLMVNEQNPEAEVLKKAQALKAKLTASNFASIAEKESQDPGSAKKGGDLGLFEKGRMVPEFEQAAFSMKAGTISEPIKTSYGYHLLYVEQHQDARKIEFDEAKTGIAKKLVAQTKTPEVLENLKKAASSGRTSEVDGYLKKLGLNWEKAENVIMGAPQIPKLADPQEVLLTLAKQKGKTGLVPALIGTTSAQYIVDVTGWKANPKSPSKDEIQRTLAQQESSDSFEAWVRDAESKASVSRNARLIER